MNAKRLVRMGVFAVFGSLLFAAAPATSRADEVPFNAWHEPLFGHCFRCMFWEIGNPGLCNCTIMDPIYIT